MKIIQNRILSLRKNKNKFLRSHEIIADTLMLQKAHTVSDE